MLDSYAACTSTQVEVLVIEERIGNLYGRAICADIRTAWEYSRVPNVGDPVRISTVAAKLL